jgi:hypothetical protein
MKISYVNYLKPQVNKSTIYSTKKSFSSLDSKDSHEVADSYSKESSEFTWSRGDSKLPNSDKSSLAPSKKSSIAPSEKSSLVSSEKSSLAPSEKNSALPSKKNSAAPSEKSSSSSSEGEESEETQIDLKLRRLGVKLIDPYFNRRPSGLNVMQGLRVFMRNSTMIGSQTIQEVQSVYEESIKDKQEDIGNGETEKLDSILKEVYDGEMEKVRSRKGYSVTSKAARPRGSAVYEKVELDRSLTQLNIGSENFDSVAALRHQFSADAVRKGTEDDEDRSMTNSIKAIIANKHKQRKLGRGGDFFILQEEKRKLTEQLCEIQNKNQMLEFEIDQLRMEANTDLETRMDKEVKRYLNELEVILKEK